MATSQHEQFDTIYHATFSQLSKYVYFKLANLNDVEDLIQNIYIDFYQYIIKKNKKVENVQSYLMQMANNEISKYYQSKKEQPILISEESTYLIDNIQDDVDLEFDILNQFESDLIYQLVKKLDVIDQKIIGGHFRFDMTFKEIALSLNTSENTIKTRYYRSLKILKQLYESSSM